MGARERRVCASGGSERGELVHVLGVIKGSCTSVGRERAEFVQVLGGAAR